MTADALPTPPHPSYTTTADLFDPNYDPLCWCGHHSTDHSDGGPAHTGYTRCLHDVNDYGVAHCPQRCMEFLPAEDTD